jgi:phage shock protein C
MVRMTDENRSKVLVRPRNDRMLAGVCAAVADYFGLDVTLVRVIWAVVSVITGGAGVLAYLVAWVIIPGEGQKSSMAENITGKNKDAWSG